MADQYYINDASAPGGNGTEDTTSGANRAFSSIQEAESTLDGTMTDDMIWNISGTGTSGQCTWGGWTPSGYSITVNGNATSTLVAYDGGTNWHAAENTFGDVLLINNDDDLTLIINDLHIRSGDGSGEEHFNIINNGSTGNTVTLNRCVMSPSGASPATDAGKVRLQSTGTGNEIKVTNCLWHSPNTGGTFIQSGNGDGIHVFNCVIIGADRGIRDGETSVNNIFQDHGSEYYGGTPATANNCLTDDGAMGGSNNVLNSTLTFVNDGSDWHLDPGDTDAINAGEGPGANADVPTLDVDGDTRSGSTCDIGADELPVGAGFYHKRVPMRSLLTR